MKMKKKGGKIKLKNRHIDMRLKFVQFWIIFLTPFIS